MDKVLKIGILIIILALLTACGANEGSTADPDGKEASLVELSTLEDPQDGEGDSDGQGREQLRADFAETALPPASQLLLGTFLMEDTEFAVDADLAQSLVPYWKLYKSLIESDTTAPEELEALISDIQEVMSVDQTNYIASLELIQEDLTTFMNESGIVESLRPEGDEAGYGTRPGRSDGMPEGTGPGSGQGGGPGAADGMDPELMATMQAKREEMGGAGGIGGSRMVTPLIEALIELLESKAG